MLALLTAMGPALLGCGGGEKESSATKDGGGGARGDRPDALGDVRPDLPPDSPPAIVCNGTCNGTCRGICTGICELRDDGGTCGARCEGTCVGSCEGPCLRVARPEAGAAITPPDAGRPDGRRPPDGGTDVPLDAGGDTPMDAPADAPPLAGWQERTRPSSLSWPPATHAGAMAYDARRGKVVMFGGWSDRTNATWEWDGDAGTWLLRQQAAGTRPAPRFGHAMVYDPARGKVVLTGGVDVTGRSTDEVWEWDGEAETWTRRGPGPTPSRWGHAAAFDESTGRIVLFGGSHRHATAGDGDLFDTWEWEPAADAWTNKTYPLPASWPRPRRGHALGFDAARKVIVLYGGEIVGLPGAAQDLWEWDGGKGIWTDRTPAPLPAEWPGPRAFHGLLTVGAGRLVLFGNFAPNLWEWNGTTWKNLTPSPLPSAWPPARPHPAAAFDGKRNTLVLSGASVTHGREQLADTWEWHAPASAGP